VSVDSEKFKKLLSQFPAGATVVTFKDGDRFGGLTVTSFCSVSLHPPLVLICIDKKTRSHDPLQAAGAYAVNICSAEMEEVARDFSRRDVNKADLFGKVGHTVSPLGSPLLDKAAAHLDCKTIDVHEAGDHSIFIAAVESGDWNDDVDTLVYNRHGYASFHHDPE